MQTCILRTLKPIPTYEEVEKALKSMKSGKSVGPDEVSAELLKLGAESVICVMHRIVVGVWKTGKWPADWTMSTFVLLFKKGDPTVCANYRTISLISHSSKVLLKVILERMRSKVESETAEEQAGFQPGRGTHSQPTSASTRGNAIAETETLSAVVNVEGDKLVGVVTLASTMDWISLVCTPICSDNPFEFYQPITPIIISTSRSLFSIPVSFSSCVCTGMQAVSLKIKLVKVME